jgi:tetratricopeptide (TPR) repeat protein
LVTFLSLALCMPALAQERLDIGIITVKQRDLADRLRDEISQGGSFSALARQHSVGPTASRGGRLGKVPLTRLRAEYQQAVKGLEPGKPSQVVPTEEGYNILYIFPEKVAEPAPLPAPEPQPSTGPETPQTGELDLSEPPNAKSGRLISEALENIAVGGFDGADGLLDKAREIYAADETAKLLKIALQLGKESDKGKEALKSTAIGMLAMQGGDFDEAAKNLDKALEHQATFWPALLMRANLHANLQEMKRARDLFANVLKLNPNSVMALESLGVYARDFENDERAREYFNRALAWIQNQPSRCTTWAPSRWIIRNWLKRKSTSGPAWSLILSVPGRQRSGLDTGAIKPPMPKPRGPTSIP